MQMQSFSPYVRYAVPMLHVVTARLSLCIRLANNKAKGLADAVRSPSACLGQGKAEVREHRRCSSHWEGKGECIAMCLGLLNLGFSLYQCSSVLVH